jgi:potassium efflux system protein
MRYIRAPAMPAVRLLLASLLATLTVGAALAQGLPTTLPGLKPGEPVKSPAAVEPPALAPDATLEKRLAEARAELERLIGDGPDRVPQGVSREDAAERRAIAERLVRAYEQIIDSDRARIEAQRRRAELDARVRAWTGFPTPPPYSVLMVDELRGAQAAARDRRNAAEARLKLLKSQAETGTDQLAKAQIAARQAAERAERAPPTERAAVEWGVELADWRARLAAVNVSMLDGFQRLAQEDAGEARDEAAFIERQLQTALAAVSFRRDDLDRVLARLGTERTALEREAAKAQATDQARRKALEAARAELAAARAAAAGSGETAGTDARIARLERVVDIRRVQAESANIAHALVRALTDLNGFSRAMWEARFSAADSSDPAKRRATYDSVITMLARIQPWRDYVASELDVVRGRLRQAETQLAAAVQDDDVALARELLLAWGEREQAFLRVQNALERERAILERWKEDAGSAPGSRPWWTYALDAGQGTLGAARAVWNFELFTAEDSLEIDGRKITVTRSVTVGKSVGAILLLVLGYLVVAWLLRRLERAMVDRLKAEPAVARIARRWLQFLLIAILFVLALDIVKIPLTVFAFLGGALAIGFGFGAQNLLKNLMSGIMLLIERPLKVGDIVEIGGVIGTVTNISIRASTLRSANGIETLVPNSTLIESNVTNWTLSNQRVRRDMKVSVAYGSDTRKVSDTLLSVADRHGQVLKEPAPRVIFEDFGADGLAFTLEFWIDFGKGADSRLIGSDLRFMTEKALAEAGIGIPFPQRDVHLDASRPLPVEVVGGAAAPAPRVAARGAS